MRVITFSGMTFLLTACAMTPASEVASSDDELTALVDDNFMGDAFAVSIGELSTITKAEWEEFISSASTTAPEEGSVETYMLTGVQPAGEAALHGGRNCFKAGTYNVRLSCFCPWGSMQNGAYNWDRSSNVKPTNLSRYYNGFEVNFYRPTGGRYEVSGYVRCR